MAPRAQTTTAPTSTTTRGVIPTTAATRSRNRAKGTWIASASASERGARLPSRTTTCAMMAGAIRIPSSPTFCVLPSKRTAPSAAPPRRSSTTTTLLGPTWPRVTGQTITRLPRRMLWCRGPWRSFRSTTGSPQGRRASATRSAGRVARSSSWARPSHPMTLTARHGWRTRSWVWCSPAAVYSTGPPPTRTLSCPTWSTARAARGPSP
mmetsp:Transcript_8325/g.33728  ORF Transcript_8325/g.33728 Transcript_8325/m.33728 type:complete len:208 (+) Transcript_8325:1855-2478(+)